MPPTSSRGTELPSSSDWYIDTVVTMPGTKPTNCAESWSEEVPVLPAVVSRGIEALTRLAVPSPLVTASRAGMIEETSSTSNTRLGATSPL